MTENLDFADNLKQTSVKALLNVLKDMKDEDIQNKAYSIDILKDTDVASEILECVDNTRKGFKEYKLKLISDISENVLLEVDIS